MMNKTALNFYMPLGDGQCHQVGTYARRNDADWATVPGTDWNVR